MQRLDEAGSQKKTRRILYTCILILVTDHCAHMSKLALVFRDCLPHAKIQEQEITILKGDRFI